MSDWFWRVIALKAAFALTCFVCSLRADDTVQKLPFCNPSNAKDSPVYTDLVIVSTLDGRLTAFSTQNGAKAWDLETQPLLSSNLHNVELTSGGKWVRLVPSLRGTLYSLSGDTIEPLPFDTEQLLSSSFKYSDDLVVAGARETFWFGLDSNTGSVIYECGSSGCNSEQQRAGAGRDVLVLRRLSATVRALDPRTGTEKWNYSVGEHDVAVSRRECVGPRGGAPLPVHVSVALHEGLVALATAGDRRPLWQHKLDAPVAGMWRLHEGSLHNIDVMWEATQTLIEGGVNQQPSLYIGSHQRQLYIQESRFYAHKLENAVSAKPIPWKLVTARPLISSGGENGDTALTVTDPDSNKLSLVTLYGTSGPVVDHGFFLYIQETCDQAVQVTEDAIESDSSPNNSHEQPDYHHIHVHVYSLWFWWKEVLLIAVSSALLMNLMIWPRFFARKLPTSPLPVSREFSVVKYRHVEKPPSLPEYSGRYEMDFTPLRCLGKGGFGVVFEARNNIDHCSYAVKRITLPKDESKRERVLREVRALAKLEHEHIVRYFNAWVEQPPPSWQQHRDRLWIKELEGASVATSEEYTSTNTKPVKHRPRDGSVTLNLHKCGDDMQDLDHEKLTEPKRLRSLSCNDSISIIFDDNVSKPHLTVSSKNSSEPPPGYRHTTEDDSYIVFAEPEHSGALSGHTPGRQSPGQQSNGLELSEAKKNSSIDKRLERVKQCDGFEVDSSSPSKKKKGHTRHWSLDACVRSASDSGAPAPTMYLYIQMQLCLSDSLHDWLRNNRTCEARADNAKNLFSQIVSAVEYVHLAGLIHRDLKPSNILFAPDGRVKVGDFGLVTHIADADADAAADADGYADSKGAGVGVRHAQHRHTYRVGTHLYMSPEQLQGRRYGYKVDIYSLGIILFELLQPFGTEAERVSCLMRLRDHHYPQHFQEKYPNEVGLLKMMLSEDPRKRPTASGVRARAPLFHCTDSRYHFALPPAPACVPALPTAPVTA